MSTTVIILAAGRGTRAGFGRNKLLAPFLGANALYYSLKAFDGVADEIIVTSSPDDREEISAIAAHFGAKVVGGGERRTDSVYNALKAAHGDIVLIHDGARPFVTREQITSCIEYVEKYGSAIVAMPAVDTIAVAEDGRIRQVPDRSNTYIVQTPQGFYLKDILKAYERAISDGGSFTDDGSVYGAYIAPATICPCGSAANKKLTFREDFASPMPPLPAIADGLRTGAGVDVHAFGKAQDFVTLCGVNIPCDCGLIAHSDGDVAVHAVMDALLSAAGLKDIGYYFPDSDRKYSGADSMKLLERVVALIAAEGYKTACISLAVQAEKPRLKKYIDEMTDNLAAATGADRSRISIGAGTCEGLGFVGEKLGIAAYCTAVLKEIKA